MNTPSTDNLIKTILLTPTYDLSAFAALAIFGLFAFVTAHVGLTPEQADVWSTYGSPIEVSEYVVRPSYWRLQSQAGQIIFAVGAFGEAAHHLAESSSEKEEN
jgi:hypothetical protein